MLRFMLASLLALSLNSVAHAQSTKRPNYKLLWEISGNNLKKPSYLFGTMHVRDSEAFDFSDSVLLKLDACEAFALEINPDSLSKEALNMFLGQDNRVNKLAQYLSEKEYRNLDSLMHARTGRSLKNFKTAYEANFSLMEQFSKKDKNTFLDSWLYSVARNQNKVILGLEDFKDQMALMEVESKAHLAELKKSLNEGFDELEDKYKSFLTLYHSGDIDAIRAATREGLSPSDYENIVTKRNSKMAENLIKQMQRYSTFAAVGAAHLPGTEGIINLLRKKGYQVTRVAPTFTGLSANYKVKKLDQKWFTYATSEGGYSVEMPIKPVPISMKSLPMELQVTLDFGTLMMFMTTHITIPAHVRNTSVEQMFESISKNFSNIGTVSNQKYLKVAGYDAIEFESGNDSQYFRVRLILRDQVAYLLAAGSMDGTTLGDDVNRFFNSVQLRPLSAASPTFQTYTHEGGAFSINVPGKVNEQLITQPLEGSKQPYKLNIFYTTDSKTGETFVFRYNDFPAGLISSNDSLYQHQTAEQAVNNMKGVNLKKKDTTYAGYPCLKFSFEVPTQNVVVHGQNILRGNRFYLQFSARPSTLQENHTKEFLNSLSLLPYQKTITKLVDFGNGLSLKVPAEFEQDSVIMREKNYTRYSLIDTHSGISFILQVEKISPYEQATSAAEYFEGIKEAILEEGDSLLSGQPVKDQFGYEYVIACGKSNALKYMRYLIADKKLYSLWSYLPADYQQSNSTKEIYDSFIINPVTSWDISSNKTDLLLHDLLSSDSTTQVTARQTIYAHPFQEDELPKVYTALRQEYPSESTEIKNALLNVLKNHHDSNTASFIQEIYATLPDTTQLRDSALGVLASLHTEKDTKIVIDLIRKDDPRLIDSYEVLYTFYDSLSLFSSVITDVIELEPRFTNSYFLYDLVRMTLDSVEITPELRQTIINQIVAMATRLANESLANLGEDHYFYQRDRWLNLASLLTGIPFTKEVKEIVLKLNASGDPEIMLTTATHLLTHKVKVSSDDLNLIAKNSLYRIQLYENLKEINQHKLIPKKYRTSRMLSESDLYNYLSYDDELPDTIVLLFEKEIVYEGKKQHIILYKYGYDGSEEWYTALSGPFVKKSKSDFQRGGLTTSFYEVYTNNEDLMRMVKTYVEEQDGTFVE